MSRSALVLAVASAFVLLGLPAHAGDDPCGGTGGVGQVVSVEKDGFTIRRHHDGHVQVVHLTSRGVIRTSSGQISLPDLVPGSRVTLVGDPEDDGTFTADAVVVCKGSPEKDGQVEESPGQSVSPVAPEGSTRQPPPAARYQHVRRVLDVATVGLACLTWCGLVLFLRRWKGVGAVGVLFLAVFSVYVYKVLDYTLLQFQSLLLLQHLVPGLQLRGLPAGTSVNLVPLISLTERDVKTSLLNVLMMLPFGFGLPFVTGLRFTRVVVAAALCSLVIEFLQWATGFLANSTFRVADVNDLIFNTAGAAVGYAIFLGLARVLRAGLRGRRISQNPILRYVDERPQLDAAPAR